MRVGAGVDNKVVLQFPLVAVVDQVNAWINAFVLHLAKGRDTAAPPLRVVADGSVLI
jgi:hypothetical protein